MNAPPAARSTTRRRRNRTIPKPIDVDRGTPSPASTLAATAPALPLGAPTENVNAPCTGCVSAEIERHATTYAPRAMPGGTPTATESLDGRVTCPSSTRFPDWSRTRIAPNGVDTDSSKRTVASVGARWSTAPLAGDVATTVACAEAAAGTASAQSTTATQTARRIRVACRFDL